MSFFHRTSSSNRRPAMEGTRHGLRAGDGIGRIIRRSSQHRLFRWCFIAFVGLVLIFQYSVAFCPFCKETSEASRLPLSPAAMVEDLQTIKPPAASAKELEPIAFASDVEAKVFQGRVPINGIMIVSCSSPRFVPGGVTAAMFTATRVFKLQYALWNPDNSSIRWNLWTVCGTAGHTRIVPSIETAEKGSIVLYIPGRTPFAAKAALWEGLVAKFGQEKAAKIAPMTFIRPAGDPDALTKYVSEHPNSTFILKTGKHRQRGTHLLSTAGNVQGFLDSIQSIDPSVAQLSMDTVRTREGNRRTAFRTYIWIRCLEPEMAVALIEWKSPAYIAVTDQDYVASGYTKSAGPKPYALELIKMLFPDNSEAQQVVRAVEAKVSAFLATFQQVMCPLKIPAEAFTNINVMEMFGFDWIPVRTSEGHPDALLLETNRFPDMALHNQQNLDDKDWLKACTVMRRFSSVSVDELYERCYQDILESRVVAHDL